MARKPTPIITEYENKELTSIFEHHGGAKTYFMLDNKHIFICADNTKITCIQE